MSLISSVDMFDSGRSEEMAVEQERQHRQAIMDDQDAAYQESLRADRAKVCTIYITYYRLVSSYILLK